MLVDGLAEVLVDRSLLLRTMQGVYLVGDAYRGQLAVSDGGVRAVVAEAVLLAGFVELRGILDYQVVEADGLGQGGVVEQVDQGGKPARLG